MVENSFSIPQQSTLGYTLQASQWQKIPVLLDTDEMEKLLLSLHPFHIVLVSGVVNQDCEILPSATFLENYCRYVTALKKGDLPDESIDRSYFTSVFTKDLHALYKIPLNRDNLCLVKIKRPVIQLQAHRFEFSSSDSKFRSMVFGMDSIHWGLLFSFPHLFQDEHLQIFPVREGTQFPNASLFKHLQRWLRAHSKVTPFQINGQRVFAPIRLGYSCFSWINNHPQLNLEGLQVII